MAGPLSTAPAKTGHTAGPHDPDTMSLFAWFESFVDPYPEAAPATAPKRFGAFLWACTEGTRPYIALMTLFTAAIGAFEGQVALYEGWRADSPCYACLVGDDPDRPGINCAEQGVMGALAGMIGTMAALEAVRALTGWGAPLAGRLAIIDMLDRRWREMTVAKEPECPICRG